MISTLLLNAFLLSSAVLWTGLIAAVIINAHCAPELHRLQFGSLSKLFTKKLDFSALPQHFVDTYASDGSFIAVHAQQTRQAVQIVSASFTRTANAVLAWSAEYIELSLVARRSFLRDLNRLETNLLTRQRQVETLRQELATSKSPCEMLQKEKDVLQRLRPEKEKHMRKLCQQLGTTQEVLIAARSAAANNQREVIQAQAKVSQLQRELKKTGTTSSRRGAIRRADGNSTRPSFFILLL